MGKATCQRTSKLKSTVCEQQKEGGGADLQLGRCERVGLSGIDAHAKVHAGIRGWGS